MSLASSSTAAPAAPAKALHVGLWVVQGLLAFAFTGAGAMKATQPIDALAAQMAWVPYFPEPMIRFIGVSELAGAAGLILPSALRIAPRLTPVAAALLVVTMVSAAATHVVIGEPAAAAPSVVLGTLAAVVAWGRWKAAPIAAR